MPHKLTLADTHTQFRQQWSLTTATRWKFNVAQEKSQWIALTDQKKNLYECIFVESVRACLIPQHCTTTHTFHLMRIQQSFGSCCGVSVGSCSRRVFCIYFFTHFWFHRFFDFHRTSRSFRSFVRAGVCVYACVYWLTIRLCALNQNPIQSVIQFYLRETPNQQLRSARCQKIFLNHISANLFACAIYTFFAYEFSSLFFLMKPKDFWFRDLWFISRNISSFCLVVPNKRNGKKWKHPKMHHLHVRLWYTAMLHMSSTNMKAEWFLVDPFSVGARVNCVRSNFVRNCVAIIENYFKSYSIE